MISLHQTFLRGSAPEQIFAIVCTTLELEFLVGLFLPSTSAGFTLSNSIQRLFVGWGLPIDFNLEFCQSQFNLTDL